MKELITKDITVRLCLAFYPGSQLMWGQKREPVLQTFAHVSNFTHFLCKSQSSGYLSMYYGLQNVRDANF